MISAPGPVFVSALLTVGPMVGVDVTPFETEVLVCGNSKEYSLRTKKHSVADLIWSAGHALFIRAVRKIW